MIPSNAVCSESNRTNDDPTLFSRSNEIDSILHKWKNDLNCNSSKPE